MAVKWRQKGEPASGATSKQNPTRRRTCFMKMVARVAESRTSTSAEMAKPVRSHMAPRIYFEPA